MSNKQTIIALIAALITGLAIGHFTHPTSIVKTEQKTTAIADNKEIVKQDKSIITSTKKPDGTVITTTHEDVTTTVQDAKHVNIADNKQESITYGQPKWAINALAVSRMLSGSPGIVWGGQLTHRFLGPFQAGIFALSDKTVGVSLGISF